MPKIITSHEVLEPLKQALLASRDVIISDQIRGSKLQRVFTLGDGCWLPIFLGGRGLVSKCCATPARIAATPPGARQGFEGPIYPSPKPRPGPQELLSDSSFHAQYDWTTGVPDDGTQRLETKIRVGKEQPRNYEAHGRTVRCVSRDRETLCESGRWIDALKN